MSILFDPRSGSAPASTAAGVGRVPRLLLVGVFVAALLGRFTLGRLGSEQYATLDLRYFAVGGLLLAAALWRVLPIAHHWRSRWAMSTRLVLLLVAYLIATALWAPPGARLIETVSDYTFLAVLLIIAVVAAGPNPPQARRTVLLAMMAAGAAYGAAGLLVGQTDQQGRTVAFGGGPNIYARVVFLGVIAALGLYALTRRRRYLLPIPAMVFAALLAGSRGCLLSAGVTGGLFLAVYGRRLSGRALAWGAALAAAVVAGGVFYVFGTNDGQALRQRFFVDIFVDHQFSDRPELLGQGFKVLLAHPLLGGGVDSFYALFGAREALRYPHNLLIEVAATGGILGLVLLGAIVVVLLREGQPWRALPADQVAMALCAFYVTVASMFTGDFYDTRFLWIFLALTVLPQSRWADLDDCCRSPFLSPDANGNVAR